MPTPFSRSSSSSSDSSQRLVSSRCPECGAPVDFRRVPRNQTQVKCSYCGTLMSIPGRSEPQPAPVRPPTVIVATSDGSAVKGGWGCGAVGWFITILIIGIAVWTFTSIGTTTSIVTQAFENESSTNNLPAWFPTISVPSLADVVAEKPRLVTAPMLLRGNESAATQIVVSAYQENGSLLVGFDPVERTETWRSTLLSDKYYDMGMSADAARIYVADGATLMALDRESGAIAWQSSLANNIQTGCTESAPCLQQVGDQVVALSRDGTIQGFAGATGAPLWSRRLNTQPRTFMVNNDQVIVVDNDDDNRAVVLVLNGVNGDLIYQLMPSCVFPNFEMRPHSSDQYWITPDGSALIIVGSGTYACAWRYSLLDGTQTWGYTSADVSGPLPFTWSMSSLTVADPVIYFIKDENDAIQIYALDSQIQGSEPQALYRVEDYKLTILYPLGNLLMVSAQPSFATDETELWAIDRSTGERRWQRKLETTHTFDDWVTHPTDQGIFLSVCFWNVDECHFEVLDIATGTSKGQVIQETNGSYSGAVWLGNQGFLTIDGKIYAINLTTAQVEYTWP